MIEISKFRQEAREALAAKGIDEKDIVLFAVSDLGLDLNYAEVYDIIRTEMQQPSQLIEHVAGRIGKSIFERFPQAETVALKVTKLNPPMDADCQGVGVELLMRR